MFSLPPEVICYILGYNIGEKAVFDAEMMLCFCDLQKAMQRREGHGNLTSFLELLFSTGIVWDTIPKWLKSATIQQWGLTPNLQGRHSLSCLNGCQGQLHHKTRNAL